MRQVVLASSLLCLGALSHLAFAAIPEKPYYIGIHYGAGQLYTGLKYHVDGRSVSDADGTPRPDLSSSAADHNARVSKSSATLINGGFHFTHNWAVEGQYMITGLLDMPFFVGNDEVFNKAKLSGSSYGLYGVYKAGTDVYFRGKLGFGGTSVGLEGEGVSVDHSGFGVTYGFSVGKKIGNLGSFEFTYMRYADAVADKTCVPIEANAAQNTACKRDGGAKRYFEFNENIRSSVITAGYVFTF